MKKIILPLLFVCAYALNSCSSSSSLYSWYNYEDVTYQYSKKQTDELQAKVLEQYEKMQNKQKGLRKTVPPGLCAEQGFMLCKNGKIEEGIILLKKEIELYPESSIYITRIIKQLEK